MPFDNKRVEPPRRRSQPFGHTTLRFFSEGEKHEASAWQDVPDLAEDELRARRLRTGHFDKVPHQRGASIALAVFGAVLALGVVLGIKALAKASRSVDASAAELRRGAAEAQHGISPPIDAGVSAPASTASP